jgi:hypothetical protein
VQHAFTELGHVFAPLILGVLAIYFFIGWIFIGALDRRVARQRRGGGLWVAILFWPITVIVDLIGGHRHG